MFLYETHMHTSPVSACAAATPQAQVRFYKKKGYAGIIITDHFFNGNNGCPQSLPWREKVDFFMQGYELAKTEGEKCGLDVFFGLEYTIDGADFLTYGLDREFLLNHPDFHKLSLAEFSAAVRAANGFIAQAHPFRQAYWIPNPVAVDPKYIDAVEVHNASMPPKINRLALNFAKEHNLPQMSGSDAHDCYSPTPSGISLPTRAETIQDIIAAIRNRQATLLCH